MSDDTGITSGRDGAVFAADHGRRRLLRYQDGQVDTISVPDVQELSDLAAGPDGGLLVGDNDTSRLLSLAADGTATALADNVLASPMTVGPAGTVFFVEDALFDGRIAAVAPGGRPRTLAGEVERDADGNPVEGPVEGARARDSYLEAADLAATRDGLYVLTFSNEVWRIGANEELELVLRRSSDEAETVLAALAAAGDTLYVLHLDDRGAGAVSTLTLDAASGA